MLIVDTNVISELMRPAPAGSVAQWFEEQPLERRSWSGLHSRPRSRWSHDRR